MIDFPSDADGFKRWRAKQKFTGELADMARIVENDKIARAQLDSKGTPSESLKKGEAEREEKLRAMLRASKEQGG